MFNKVALLLIFLVTSAFSQKVVTLNIIDSSTSKPLKKVRVEILSTEFVSGSDSNGTVIFEKVSDGYYTFYFTCIGYYPYTINLDINEKNTNNFTIKLPKAKHIKVEH